MLAKGNHYYYYSSKVVQIIYIDDDKKWHDILRFSLPEYSIISSYTGKTGLNMIIKTTPDLVILNNKLPDMNVIEVLKRINLAVSPPPVIIMGNCNAPHDVVSTIQYGAVDFLSKPVNLYELKQSILRAVSLKKNKGDAVHYENCRELDLLVGESEKLMMIKHEILLFALSDASVLISGETGTGKDLIARAIHRLSKRIGPFHVIPAGAIPLTLLESLLYGTEKGAFTDAVSQAGYFEKANKGTLFIDEIGEMPTYAQVKLLRILEDKEISRIGGREKIPIDVRIVSATNVDMQRALQEKEFRMDLYYRISTLTITVPPLRERKDDIPLLVDHFLKREHFAYSLSNTALLKLMEYSWPGNIRELKNVIHRAMVLSGNKRIEDDTILTGRRQ